MKKYVIFIFCFLVILTFISLFFIFLQDTARAEKESAIIFTNDFSEHTKDTDGDGLIENLIIEVGINVSIPGYYNCFGILHDATNREIAYGEKYTYLEHGKQIISLKFNGKFIRANKARGNYTLKKLSIFNQENESISYYQEDPDNIAYVTKSYNYTDFEIPEIAFTNTFLDHGEDIDGDGAFEFLTLEVGLDVAEPGNYTLTSSLYDSKGTFINSASKSTYLAVGSHKIHLNFNGEDLSHHMLSGNFTIKDFQIFDHTFNAIGFTSNIYVTSYYTYTQFAIPLTAFSLQKFIDYGEDIDNNGLYDVLTLEVALNINKAGKYRLVGFLLDPANQYITTNVVINDLDTRLQKIKLNFDGGVINQRALNGSYKVDLELYGPDTTLLDTYTTSWYNSTDFEYPSVTLVEITGDHGLDVNGDGKFDYLTLDLKLDSTRSGKYTLSTCLIDDKGNPVIAAKENVTIGIGEQSVSMNFDGSYIYDSYLNGTLKTTPFEIYDETGALIGYQDFGYTTSNYSFAEFAEQSFTPKFQAFDFPPTLIIFITIIIVLIAILVFKTARKPRKKKPADLEKPENELDSEKE